ncbi:MAG: hypothetical protein H0X39_13905 [Actinobacteria bacterium]|nr:hypothetical protein [Actinomycetota bacterium]
MTSLFDSLRPFLDASALVHALNVDSEGAVSGVNDAAARRLERTSAQLVGLPLSSLVTGTDRAAAAEIVNGTCDSAVLQFVPTNLTAFPLSVQALRHPEGFLLLGEPPILPYLRIGDDLTAHANDLAVQSRERARQTRKLAGQLAAHESSHWHLARDQAVLPICVTCGRVKTVEFGWEDLADFVQRSGRFLSHTYCDSCAREELDG